jgi:hypothetical protein
MIRTHDLFFDTMLNYQLSQKLKLIGIDKFNYLIYISIYLINLIISYILVDPNVNKRIIM